MATLTYPLVIWPIKDDQYLGQVIGTDYTVIDESEQSIVRSASDYVSRSFKHDDYVFHPVIKKATLKTYDIVVQLVYRNRVSAYPLPGRTVISVAAIYGPTEDEGVQICYVPQFDRSFYYYDLEQLKTMIEHFVRSTLERLPPENAIQYKMPVKPKLTEIKVTSARATAPITQDEQSTPEVLRAVCDRTPFEQDSKRSVSRLPQVGWEREADATKLASRIINTQDNVLIVGEQGVGKTTVWNDAIKIVARQTKNAHKSSHKSPPRPVTVWRSTAQRLISRAKYLGEWQEYCDSIVDALTQVNGILWITDIQNLIHIGGESYEDSVAAYLQPYIEKSQLRLLGEITPTALESCQNALPGFIRCFERQTLLELDSSASMRVLHQANAYANENFKITVENEALDLIKQLVDRFIVYEKSPGKHVNFFNECMKSTISKQNTITTNEVIDRFSRYTGLPETLLRDDYPLNEQDLLSYFGSKIIGQDPVLEQLCRVVQSFKAGLNDPNKPIATMLFVGPTGVGKTEAVKALSSFFFEAGQKRNPLFRLDMSEFQNSWQISRLIGDRQKPSELIQHVRSQPFSVILLDEIEKAHSTIFDAFLTLFDEGLFTDRFGRTTDFRSAMIIMTSNLGSDTQKTFGFNESTSNEGFTNSVRKFFRPEFFNRIDEVVSFGPLSESSILKITRIELDKIQQRDRLQESGIEIQYTAAVAEFIAQKGYSQIYGARPIQRSIEKHVVRAISQFVLLHPECKQLTVDVKDGVVSIDQ